MKKINQFLILLLITVATSLTSCTIDVEPLHPNVIIPVPEPDPQPISGDYWPMAVNNTWTYKKDGTAQPEIKITGTEVFNGKTYFKYSNFVGTTLVDEANFSGDVWTRKENNTYYLREGGSLATQTPGLTMVVLPTDLEVLKDNLAVNETWTQNYTQNLSFGTSTIPSTVTLVGKILEKDSQLIVNGQTYNNVIKVELTQTTIISRSNYYWFAKGVGLIKYEKGLNSSQSTFEIVSYNLN